jgi:hypothetical protein
MSLAHVLIMHGISLCHEYTWYYRPALLGVRLPMIFGFATLCCAYTRAGDYSYLLENSVLGQFQVRVAQASGTPALWTGQVFEVLPVNDPVMLHTVRFYRSAHPEQLAPDAPVCGFASNNARWVIAHYTCCLTRQGFDTLFQEIANR